MTKELIIKAPAKLNIALDIVGVRRDGYHLLSMVNTEVVKMFDLLTVGVSEDDQCTVSISCDDPEIPCGEKNICYKAAKTFIDKIGGTFSVKIHIEKKIPHEAGLGGGSSDAAAVLKALDILCGTGLGTKYLAELGAKIGADVPFCVYGGTARCGGVGEIVEPLGCEDIWERKSLIMVKPKFGISTVEAFKKYDGLQDGSIGKIDIDGVIKAIKRGDMHILDEVGGNVLETVAEEKYPIMRDIRCNLKKYGADTARMTGSGTAVFGIFDSMNGTALKEISKKILEDTDCEAHIYAMSPECSECITLASRKDGRI